MMIRFIWAVMLLCLASSAVRNKLSIVFEEAVINATTRSPIAQKTPNPTGNRLEYGTPYYYNNGEPRYCVNQTELVYAANGNVSTIGTLVVCLTNIEDGLIFPNYGRPALNISTQVLVNNLMGVQELTNEVTLDMFFTMEWTDYRLNMPDLWRKLGSKVSVSGINLQPALQEQLLNGQQLGIWQPNLVFPEAINYDVNNMYLKIFPYGLIQSQQHVILTLVQTSFDYRQYPNDVQTIVMRFFPFTQPEGRITLMPLPNKPPQQGFQEPALLFEGYNGVDSFTENPGWSFQSISGHFGIQAASNGFLPRSCGYVTIVIARQPQGLVLKLCVPVLLLVLLAAVTFWADQQTRVETTVVLLLSVSALYIVILQYIPLIGYLTKIDFFFLAMFSLMFASSLLHQLINRALLQIKVHKWPLRPIYVKVLEFMGRMTVWPVALFLYITQFAEVLHSIEDIHIIVAAIALLMIFIGVREVMDISNQMELSMKAIAAKIELLENCSTIELLVFNLYKYGIYSETGHHHLMKIKEKEQQREEREEKRAAEAQRRRQALQDDEQDEQKGNCEGGLDGDGIAMTSFTL